ncbi:hypothetical protein KGA66_06045 [Actinocrinis puniceicyclus]|uniref:Uncharacterized protein n=1 Tax=Actinocrinis puniceicyclus TaxID=977794 RepID=A0A8J7WKL5_9ACTN|nr:hypothetical protein [Actinocrinis puniceicyclus]MBS2962600.1 hypothetical protein [Actinocrinis puniceicyclus]
MSTSMSQIWHDSLDELEQAVAPIKHLFGQHQAAFDAAVKDLRDKADAEVSHLVGDAEAAGKTVLGEAEAAAAPLVTEAEQAAADLTHTAAADLHDVVGSNSTPGPAPEPTGSGVAAAPQSAEQSTPETAA